MKKVALALSGGVDSALSAALLKQQGYDVTGVFFQLFSPKKQPEAFKLSQQHLKDAKQIAQQLNISFKEIDLSQQHYLQVVKKFIEGYQEGLSPNPCIFCNKAIKFGLFYDWAMENSFDAMATGHYAQIKKQNSTLNNQSKSLFLISGLDQLKDQTYFLYQLNQQKLNHIIFPIGHLTKPQVRQQAKKIGLKVANKTNSANICFLAGEKPKNYLKKHLTESPGDVITTNQQIIGKHYGLWMYTIGQRQGFYINTKQLAKTQLLKDKHNPPPLYVVGKNFIKNQLIVGEKSATIHQQLTINKLHLINSAIKIEQVSTPLFVKIRHPGKKIACTIQQTDERWQIATKKNIAGLAPGQSVVLYTKINDDFLCLGGGLISE